MNQLDPLRELAALELPRDAYCRELLLKTIEIVKAQAGLMWDSDSSPLQPIAQHTDGSTIRLPISPSNHQSLVEQVLEQKKCVVVRPSSTSEQASNRPSFVLFSIDLGHGETSNGILMQLFFDAISPRLEQELHQNIDQIKVIASRYLESLAQPSRSGRLESDNAQDTPTDFEPQTVFTQVRSSSAQEQTAGKRPSFSSSSAIASEDRDVGMRTRSDLVIQTSIFQGETCWIVKDPFAMKYFRIREPEYLVLKELENPTSYSRLKTLLSRKFPEQRIRVEAIQQLVINLHRNGLLITGASGQAKPLIKKRNKELRQKALALLSSLVSLRLPGFDPEPLLNWMYPKTKWFFSSWFSCVVATICLSAVVLVASNFSEFYSKLPDFQSFFAVDNLLFMGAILIFTKTVHEFGHGLMCKHFGGECHEIGFMLLVLTPAMYCNTSDSWILPNRWHRIAIGAAGMYVELFMAAICTFVWWYTHPGWLHYFCLNLMFLSSVSTVLFNINPLLRYDGYYMLSDFLEIPNLSEKSKMALLSKLRVWCLGMKPVNARLLPQRNQEVFAVYSVASFIYRWAILILIFWFVTEIFEPWGLAAIGHIVVGISLIGMVVIPLWKAYKFFTYPGRLREVKRGRFVATSILLLFLTGFVCFYDLPHFVQADFVLQPKNPQRVVVSEPGNLISVLVRPGDRVVRNQLLAKLENPELELKIEGLNGEMARLQSDLAGYQSARNQFLDAGKKIAETVSSIEDVKKQLKWTQRQQNRLELRANRSGMIIPPPSKRVQNAVPGALSAWTGSPLDESNFAAWLEADTLFCLVADPKEFEASLVVTESDVELLKPNQPTLLLLEQVRNTILRASLSYVSREELERTPAELSQTNGGPIAVAPDGSEKPLLKSFEAKANFASNEFDRANTTPITGFYGVARIRVGNASLGTQMLRYLRTIINFR